MFLLKSNTKNYISHDSFWTNFEKKLIKIYLYGNEKLVKLLRLNFGSWLSNINDIDFEFCDFLVLIESDIKF